jgi:hypothetical protein
MEAGTLLLQLIFQPITACTQDPRWMAVAVAARGAERPRGLQKAFI